MRAEVIQEIIENMEVNRKWEQFLNKFNVDAREKGFFQGATFDYGSCAPVRGACANIRNLRLNKEQIEEVNEVLNEFRAPILEELKRRNQEDELAPLSEIEKHERGLTCWGGKNSIYIAWDGRMYPCDMAEFPYTFPFEQGFTAAAFDIRQEIDNLVMPKRCMSCANQDIFCTCIPKALNEMKDCARKGEKCNYVPIKLTQ